jgi:hypothetical protein
MSVQLKIISGARNGECIELDCNSFRIGADATCQIYINPAKDRGVADRSVLITLDESGWKIQNAGTGTVRVNQIIVEGSTPLRSGDIIRMSQMGPDLMFTLVTTGRGTFTGSDHLTRSVRDVASETEDDGEKAQVEASEGRISRAAVVFAVLTGVIAFVLLAIAISYRAEDKPAVDVPTHTVSDGRPPVSPPDEMLDATLTESTHVGPTVGLPGGSLTGTSGNVKDPASTIRERVSSAVSLIVAVEPQTGTAFPYGTASAIRHDALLTNGLLAIELRKRLGDGWQVWAEWPVTGERFQVTDIRVHRGFAATYSRPSQETIYWDLAILSIQGDVQNLVELVTPGDVSQLEPDCQVMCVGVPHNGEPLTRFDDARIQFSQGTLFERSTLSAGWDIEGAEPAVLLHLDISVPENSYGSAIVNESGELVAIYAEKAKLPDGGHDGQRQIHYAPVVTPVSAWLQGQGVDHWIASE